MEAGDGVGDVGGGGIRLGVAARLQCILIKRLFGLYYSFCLFL